MLWKHIAAISKDASLFYRGCMEAPAYGTCLGARAVKGPARLYHYILMAIYFEITFW